VSSSSIRAARHPAQRRGEDRARALVDIAYEYARLNLDNIPFTISVFRDVNGSGGTIIQRIAGSGAGGIVGDYYKFCRCRRAR